MKKNRGFAPFLVLGFIAIFAAEGIAVKNYEQNQKLIEKECFLLLTEKECQNIKENKASSDDKLFYLECIKKGVDKERCYHILG